MSDCRLRTPHRCQLSHLTVLLRRAHDPPSSSTVPQRQRQAAGARPKRGISERCQSQTPRERHVGLTPSSLASSAFHLPLEGSHFPAHDRVGLALRGRRAGLHNAPGGYHCSITKGRGPVSARLKRSGSLVLAAGHMCQWEREGWTADSVFPLLKHVRSVPVAFLLCHPHSDGVQYSQYALQSVLRPVQSVCCTVQHGIYFVSESPPPSPPLSMHLFNQPVPMWRDLWAPRDLQRRVRRGLKRVRSRLR
jgi:hypothetical protein